MIINYDLPIIYYGNQKRLDLECYVHRCGRAGRYGRQGLALTLIHTQEAKKQLEEIQRELGRNIPQWSDDDLLALAEKLNSLRPTKD
jgi:ATP-dependent RNA helicase DDX19/DBP5